MIKPYIAQLQFRLKSLEQIVGDIPTFEKQTNFSNYQLQQIQQKLSQGKDNKENKDKDLLRKYTKLKSYVQVFDNVLSSQYNQDKENIVVDQLELLNDTTEVLHEIQRLLPSMNTEEYTKNINKFSDLRPLYTISQVKISEQNDLKIINHNPELLQSLLQKQQKEMNAIMQLNYRMLNNLNEKIRLAYQKKMKK